MAVKHVNNFYSVYCSVNEDAFVKATHAPDCILCNAQGYLPSTTLIASTYRPLLGRSPICGTWKSQCQVEYLELHKLQMHQNLPGNELPSVKFIVIHTANPILYISPSMLDGI